VLFGVDFEGNVLFEIETKVSVIFLESRLHYSELYFIDAFEGKVMILDKILIKYFQEA
jgi:hypothetical protein